jgi:hypothetical protein
MPLIAVVAGCIGLGGLAGAAHADTRVPDLAVYAAVEPVNREDYEQQVQAGALKKFFDLHREQFWKLVAQSKDKPVRGNWMDRIDDADDWIKMLFYNKASMAVACAAEAKLDAQAMAKRDNPAFKTAFLPCFDKEATQMIKFIGADNGFVAGQRNDKRVFLSADKFAAECEPKARQTAREKALKPYAYLTPKKPASLRLMSFFVYNTCRDLAAYNIAYKVAFPADKGDK